MKPREQKPTEVYRIIERETGGLVGSYSRDYCDEYDFNSAEEARLANCHGMFKDKKKYAIAKYRVTYELIDPDIPTPHILTAQEEMDKILLDIICNPARSETPSPTPSATTSRQTTSNSPSSPTP